ncbi:MAG: hypothetical protein WCG82_08775 [Bacteroidota bacterium]
MLRAHTDKEIIIDAYRAFKKDWIKNPRDFLDFLREGSDLTIYGTPNQSENSIISYLLQGRGDAQISQVDTALSEIHNKFNPKNPFQVFFFNTSEETRKTKLRKQVNNLLSGFTDDYKEVFTKLATKKYFRVGDVESPFEFSDWAEVLPDLPVSDIIITDPYLFDDCDGKNPIKENYYRLLDEIAKKYKLDSLIVFSKRPGRELKAQLIADSQEILGKNQVHILTFEGILEHDRYIFMNYHTINAGGSMNYFNDEGVVSVKYASKIDVIPVCNGENFNIAQDVLRRLSQEIERLKDKGRIPISVHSKLFYFQKG